MKNKPKEKERFFCIELKSKTNLKNVILANGPNNGVLVEGTIGDLVQATFAEGLILEIIGNVGVLRINLEEDEIKRTAESQKEGKA